MANLSQVNYLYEPGGSDNTPMTYNNPFLQQIYVDDRAALRGEGWEVGPYGSFPELFFPTKATPGYPPYDVRGNSTMIQQHIARFGLATFTVRSNTYSGGGPSGVQGGPPYCDCTIDSVLYKIQIGQSVTLPRNVMDTINGSPDFSAS